MDNFDSEKEQLEQIKTWLKAESNRIPVMRGSKDPASDR